MTTLTRKKTFERARQYILAHPDVSYEGLTKILGNQDLSKQYFFNMRNQLRKKGKIPTSVSPGSRTNQAEQRHSTNNPPLLVGSVVEILETLDTTGFSDEVKAHWKAVVLPVLQRLLPGKKLSLAFTFEPATLEIRRGA